MFDGYKKISSETKCPTDYEVQLLIDCSNMRKGKYCYLLFIVVSFNNWYCFVVEIFSTDYCLKPILKLRTSHWFLFIIENDYFVALILFQDD